MSHEEVRQLLALHALGALDADEIRRLESHLAICSACSRELDELGETASRLTLATDPVSPSPAVTDRVFEVSSLPASRSPGEWAAIDPALSTRRKRWSWRPLPLFAGVAAAAVITLLAVSQVNLLRRLEESIALLDRMSGVGEFLTSPDVSIVPLWGKHAASRAHAKLAYDRRTGRALLFSSTRPPPPPDTRYQLWVIAERIQPAGVIAPGPMGSTVMDHRLLPEPGVPFVFGVSLERLSEVDEPTGEIVLLSGGSSAP